MAKKYKKKTPEENGKELFLENLKIYHKSGDIVTATVMSGCECNSIYKENEVKQKQCQSGTTDAMWDEMNRRLTKELKTGKKAKGV